jgi:ribosomal protein L22
VSAEDEKEDAPGETPVEPAAEAAEKPAAKKRAAKQAAQKPAAEAEEPKAEEPKAKTKKPAKAKVAKARAAKPEADAGEQPSGAQEEPVAKKKAAEQERPAEEEPAAEPTPAARRAGPLQQRAAVSARARYVRTSARKARMVCGHLRGKSVQEARAILAFTPRDVARDWSKLLESAVANAENNHELLEDDLVVREAYADEGPTIKRFRPRAMGRATPIRKRTSHLTITLTPRS